MSSAHKIAEDLYRTHFPEDQVYEASNGQIGGTHYSEMKIQAGLFCEVNGLSHFESNVVKRMCRWRKKGGLKDLLKAKHEIDLMIEAHEVTE